jgi:predicted metal-dependent phosphoesterase TrpH
MIDLHTHSTFSDGTLTPEELVAKGVEAGLYAMALTDHDSTNGTPRFLAAATKSGIVPVSGVEISAKFSPGTMHILGYYVDPMQDDLARALSTLQIARDERNEKIIKKLQDLGIDASLEELQGISGLGQTGRPHIAKLLMNHGVVRSFSQAFDEYLAKDKKAYVGRFAYSAKEAIRFISAAGGLAVLAHPIQIDKTLCVLNSLLPVLRSYGLDGIETYYPSQKKKMQKRIRKFAEANDLFLTGGSDYHGDIRPGTRLAGGHNVYVPPELLTIMKQRLESKLMDS